MITVPTHTSLSAFSTLCYAHKKQYCIGDLLTFCALHTFNFCGRVFQSLRLTLHEASISSFNFFRNVKHDPAIIFNNAFDNTSAQKEGEAKHKHQDNHYVCIEFFFMLQISFRESISKCSFFDIKLMFSVNRHTPFYYRTCSIVRLLTCYYS